MRVFGGATVRNRDASKKSECRKRAETGNPDIKKKQGQVYVGQGRGKRTERATVRRDIRTSLSGRD